MRVALFSDAFARTKRFGLSRFSHSLYGALVRQGVDAVPTSSISEFGSREPDWLRATGFRRIPVRRPLLAAAWATGASWPKVEQWTGDVEIVHTLDNDYPVATRKPWIVTYHDLGVLSHPEYFGKARPWLLKTLISASVRRASAIICVSKATADEFLTYGGAEAIDRVHVVEEGVSDEFFGPADTTALADIKPEYLERPFFLFTGSLSPRKNLARVLKAFARVAEAIPETLILTGAYGWDANVEMDMLAQYRDNGRIVELGYVSNEALKALYGRATAFLYPSLYEGFGLPVLEAMAAACPVITSALTPMVEVAGDAAVLVDPCSVNQLADALVAISRDQALRARCQEAGRIRAGRFSWDECARQTIRLYEECRNDKRS